MSYETWLIIKEMGHELRMVFYPDGHVIYSTLGVHEDTEAQNAAVRAAI